MKYLEFKYLLKTKFEHITNVLMQAKENAASNNILKRHNETDFINVARKLGQIFYEVAH